MLFEAVDRRKDPVFYGKAMGILLEYQTGQKLAEFDKQMSDILVDNTLSVRADPTLAVAQAEDAIIKMEAELQTRFDENNPAYKEQFEVSKHEILKTILAQDGIPAEQQEALFHMASTKQAGEELRRDYTQDPNYSAHRDRQRKTARSFWNNQHVKNLPSMGDLAVVREDYLNGSLKFTDKKEDAKAAYFFTEGNWEAIQMGEQNAQNFLASAPVTFHSLSNRISKTNVKMDENLDVPVNVAKWRENQALRQMKELYKDPKTREIAAMQMDKRMADTYETMTRLHKSSLASEQDKRLARNMYLDSYVNVQLRMNKGNSDPQEITVFDPEQIASFNTAMEGFWDVKVDDKGNAVFTDAQEQALFQIMGMVDFNTPTTAHLAVEQLKKETGIGHGWIEVLMDTAPGDLKSGKDIMLSLSHVKSKRERKSDPALERMFRDFISEDRDLKTYLTDQAYGAQDLEVASTWATHFSPQLVDAFERSGIEKMSDLKGNPELQYSVFKDAVSQMKSIVRKNYKTATAPSGEVVSFKMHNNFVRPDENGEPAFAETDYSKHSQAVLDDAMVKVGTVGAVVAETMMPDYEDISKNLPLSAYGNSVLSKEDLADIRANYNTPEDYQRWKDAWVQSLTVRPEVNGNLIIGRTDSTGRFFPIMKSDGGHFGRSPMLTTTIADLDLLPKRMRSPFGHTESASVMRPMSGVEFTRTYEDTSKKELAKIRDQLNEIHRLEDMPNEADRVFDPHFGDSFIKDWAKATPLGTLYSVGEAIFSDEGGLGIPFIDLHKDKPKLKEEEQAIINKQLSRLWADPDVMKAVDKNVEGTSFRFKTSDEMHKREDFETVRKQIESYQKLVLTNEQEERLGFPSHVGAHPKRTDLKVYNGFMVARDPEDKSNFFVGYAMGPAQDKTLATRMELKNQYGEDPFYGPWGEGGNPALDGSSYDDGHVAAQSAVGTVGGTKGQLESFGPDNITAMRASFNRGFYKEIEQHYLKESQKLEKGEFIYVLAGNLPTSEVVGSPERGTTPRPDKHWIVFYKAGKDGEMKPDAFLIDEDTAWNRNFESAQVPIDRISEVANMDVGTIIDWDSRR
jgi:hypothetical protein